MLLVEGVSLGGGSTASLILATLLLAIFGSCCLGLLLARFGRGCGCGLTCWGLVSGLEVWSDLVSNPDCLALLDDLGHGKLGDVANMLNVGATAGASWVFWCQF